MTRAVLLFLTFCGVAFGAHSLERFGLTPQSVFFLSLSIGLLIVIIIFNYTKNTKGDTHHWSDNMRGLDEEIDEKEWQ
jgi:predicted tellurium resistance membrane protein TerC